MKPTGKEMNDEGKAGTTKKAVGNTKRNKKNENTGRLHLTAPMRGGAALASGPLEQAQAEVVAGHAGDSAQEKNMERHRVRVRERGRTREKERDGESG